MLMLRKSRLWPLGKGKTASRLTQKPISVTAYIEELTGSVPDSDPVAQLHSEFYLEVFAHAVAVLPTRCRRVLMLRKLRGLTPLEIGAELELPVAAVETHLSRGLLTCAEYIEAKGYGLQNLRIVNHREGGRG